MNPNLSVKTSDQSRAILDGLTGLTNKKVYVGIPSTTAEERRAKVAELLAVKRLPKRFQKRKSKLEGGNINNAQLMYIHTNGSPIRKIPARPVIEPAIEDAENKEAISVELKGAADAALDGKPEDVTKQLKQAGLEAQNRVRKWFTNPKNNWPPNKPATIKAKGSSRPLIDTGALRQSVTYVVPEE